MNGDRFNFLRNIKWCSICRKSYHETEKEHDELHHEKDSRK